MTPRQAILTLLREDPESLGKVLEALGIPRGEDPEADLRLLGEDPRASTSALLSHLGHDALRQVSASCGLLTRGEPGEIRERIGRRDSFAGPAARSRRNLATRTFGGRWRYQGEPFVAIDFETADRRRDSACSVALVRVEDDAIQRTETRLIRPPRSRFEFTHIHGLTWEMVQDAGDFGEVWPELEELLDGVSFLVAHNAPFDRGVLEACCRSHGLLAPSLPFHCTVKLARRTWNLRRARLPDVCGLLGIPLKHHDATSDARACAQIVLESRRAVVRADL